MKILVLILLCLAGLAHAAERMNVLYIVVDDLEADLAAYGHTTVKSPNIDRLIARGVKFERGYTQFPLCNPSRTSFLSGLRPETSGALLQEVVLRDRKPDVVFMPGYFKQHGWFTAGAGKVFHQKDPVSWDEFEDGKPKSKQEQAAVKSRASRRADGEAGAEWLALDCTDEETGDGGVARTVVGQMERAVSERKPFFLGAGFRKPHLPWTAPRKYFDLYPPASVPVAAEPPMVESRGSRSSPISTARPRPSRARKRWPAITPASRSWTRRWACSSMPWTA